ncbi:LysR family transcriptional regulator [Pseudomonas syringae pv. actinidiae]|nr:LysR family transcriptional regulator [Pseudomonas syringae pv. actinidiae]
MRLNLRQLQIFCAITRFGSTTSAGNALALSQSATSAALNELESALGTRLFDRGGQAPGTQRQRPELITARHENARKRPADRRQLSIARRHVERTLANRQ